MKEIDATTVRRELRTVLDRAYVHGEPTSISRHGEVIALVVPADWLAALVEAGKVIPVQSAADQTRD